MKPVVDRAAVIGASLIAALALLVLPQPLGAVDEDSSGLEARDPDYAAGRRAIEGKQWDEAIQHLARVALRESDNPDVHNLLGFSYRQAGKLDLALAEYERALAIDPRHKGAHEYIGEAYLKMNDLAAATRHLEALRKLCPLSCEQLRDLEREIAQHTGTTRR